MRNNNNGFIVTAKRTPIGAFQGSLASVSATDLGSAAIKAVLDDSKIDPKEIDEVIMGCVLPAGLGQAPARQAALGAGLPDSVECMTINKVCGSGLKAVMLAIQAIQTGDADVIVAGGMENMSAAPYLLEKGRDGYRLGHGQLTDSMIKDGLWDPYNDVHMGNCAELCAEEKNHSREDQDAFAQESYERAQKAQAGGKFDAEICAVQVPQRKGDPLVVDTDDEPGKANFEKMKTLPSAFIKDGSITAANASKINDGAAAVLLVSAEKCESLGLKPMAQTVAQASAAQEPKWFTTAPSIAISKCLEKAGMQVDDIEAWEINEAFAPVTMAAMEDHSIDHEKVNMYGGAIALGHPIGASGARILTTLLNVMKQEDKQTGLATLCIGGGESSALIVKNVK
ncbi:MAG: thiolase family protein [Candidatus Marinimicrobia bacterium]|nr:thiolase family protein [Candidatus Neomarinimicrobiota bacterium]MDP6789529.1 thiolase family protein [Candidatus Neomarinimicrobiota bacterium]MDP7072435.1 thiolase family protein [Candidatus Neomarinimicrobiota bacterium]